MKRCRFGLGLLIFLLIGSALVTRVMTQQHKEISRSLEHAAAAADAKNWEEAARQFAAARKEWEDGWHFSAAFADHEPMEEIDGLFAQAEIYLCCRDPEALAAVCAQLSRMTEAVGEAHALNWRNFL